MWLAVITMTTVGFGDMYPATNFGRIVGVVACFIGMILVSLAIVSLTNITEFSVREEKAYKILKQMQARDGQKYKAANVIKNALRLKSTLKMNGPKKFSQRFVYYCKLKQHIGTFKNDNKFLFIF